MRTFRMLGIVSLIVGGLLVLLLTPLGIRAGAQKHPQGTLCVTPGGTGGCYATLQAAVDAATDGDTIRVAQGTYAETVVLTKSLTLEGGWSTDFTTRDWAAHVTTIDAQRNGSVIQIHGTVSPTIEGFVITGGDGSAYLGWGGGIEVYGAAVDGGGTVIIRHNVITDNVACRLGTCQGEGGGIRVGISTAIIEHNTIVSNTARLSAGGGKGGGVMIGWGAQATLTSNTIVSNTAAHTPTSFSSGQGGGVYGYSASSTLTDNDIHDNVAAVDGSGYGGGAYLGGELSGNRITGNTASINGNGYGGGVYALYVLRCDDNTIQSNVASRTGDGTGGGIWAQYLKQAEGNTIADNTAARGGGLYYTSYLGNLTLRDNLIARNQATGTSTAAPPDGGGGIASYADKVTILDNTIVSNTAQSAGGGVLIDGGTEYMLRSNHVATNTALAGGGIHVYTATGTIAHNQVVSNMAVWGGGVYLWGAARPVLESNEILSNTAMGFWGSAGGGISVNVDAGIPVTLTNHIIAHNVAGSGGPGGGVCCWQGDCALINNTIVDNNRGSYKEGVILGNSSYAGTYTLTNNIIVGHSVGVQRDNGTATLDYNAYSDNTTDVSGTTWGAHHRTDAPQFVDRAGQDYHLALTSPLVDVADGNAAPAHDFEGDPRPRGGGFDIGADEAYPAEVYVSANVGSDLTGTGTPAQPFASVTKGLAEVRSAGTVYVARGHYTERITVTRSVALLGGYRESGWSRDIVANTTTLDAQGTGTTVVINGEDTEATIEGFVITGGEASMYGVGGGLLVTQAKAVTVRYNTIHGNHANNGGGGLFVSTDTTSRIEANRVYNNVADGVTALYAPADAHSPAQGPEPGGGMLVSNPAYVVNNLIYSNTAAAGGDGVAFWAFGETPVRFLHNTVVDNGGAEGTGVELRGAAAEMYNNLIVGHGTAISGTQATWDYNGFYDNGDDYATGLSAGTHDVPGDPTFADRAGYDYHIGPGSAGAGRGTDLGVTIDLDGNVRPAPVGTAPDLGAYEVAQRHIYLPLVLRE